MAKDLAKITVACPYCGGTQQETEHARSTFCRKCGRHIELAKRTATPPPVEQEGPGIIDKLGRIFQRERVRHVTCLHCNAVQAVSSLAKSGTCHHCGDYLDFRDVKVDGNFSKVFETHGTITITKTGELTSPKVSCAAAIVMGKVNGNLVCSTSAHVSTKGRVLGTLQARELVIEKQADVAFVRPLHVRTAEINGKITARIFADSVTINKTGALEGAVTARSIKIERGGIFRGDLAIGQQRQEQQQELPLPERAAEPRRDENDLGGGDQMLMRRAT